MKPSSAATAGSGRASAVANHTHACSRWNLVRWHRNSHVGLPLSHLVILIPMGQGVVMRRSASAALVAAIMLGVAACGEQSVTSPGGEDRGFTPRPGSPLASANANCVWSPSGEISIPVGNIQTFAPSSSTDCSGSYVVITATGAGVLGFLLPAGTCTVVEKTVSALKVKKCLAGSGLIKIYTNSSKTTLIQQIGVDRAP